MTVTSATPSPRTVVLLAEPGAGRARRLMMALTGLSYAAGDASDGADDGQETPAVEDIGALLEQVLDAAGVRADDARPRAWPDVANAVTPDVEAALSGWLERGFTQRDTLLVTDRLAHWLLPVWLRVGAELGARVTVVMAIRRPDRSADRQDGAPPAGRPGDITRSAAWLNQALVTERASRGVPTVVIPVDEVVDDWVAATARVGEALDLAVIRDASATALRSTQQVLDKAPATATEPAEQVALPPRLAELVERAWSLLERRARAATDLGALERELDETRAASADYYLEAEAVARSSIRAVASRRPGAKPPTPPAEPPSAWRRLTARRRSSPPA